MFNRTAIGPCRTGPRKLNNISHNDAFPWRSRRENNEKYIWNPATGEKLANAHKSNGSFSDQINDWLVVTPAWLFDGSNQDGARSFGSRRHTFDVNPGETFFNEFYYPVCVARS